MNMTIRLVLVTHASTEATAAARFPRDEPLDARGRTAATAARGTLRRFDGVFRGPERRCEETAEALGLESALIHPPLTDLDTGAWRGRTLTGRDAGDPAEPSAGLSQALTAWLTDPSAAPHGGESLSALADRVAGWLGERASEGRARIIAVTHPAVVRAAVLHALGAPVSCFWRLDAAPLTQTRLSHRDGRWQLGETGHSLG
jgi:broad specificity phosphatase PhoE